MASSAGEPRPMKTNGPDTGAAVFEPATGMAERRTTSLVPAPKAGSPESLTSHLVGT